MPTQQANDLQHSLLNLATPTSGLRKTLTSILRHQRTEIIAAIYLALILFGCFTPTAAELYESTTTTMENHPSLTQRLTRNARTNFIVNDNRCKSCQLYRQMTSLADVTKPTSRVVNRLIRAQVKHLARACGLTYEQYRLLCRNAETHDIVTSHQPNEASVTSLTERLLSRKRRLASDGDVKIRRLSSKTGFYLEIRADGSVRGVSTPSIYTTVEIKAVHEGGVVRIFGTAAEKYLAMTDAGHLYGSSEYNPRLCDFVEVVQPNFYNTYHSRAQPSGWRRRRRNKKWYVALNKSGKPRKASSARVDLPSSWFLPTEL